MTPNDTISAIATPSGKGGVGIVRISGPDALSIALDLTAKPALAPRYASYVSFFDKTGEIIDQGLAIYFPAPHSFTGEDVVELHGHGGPVVMDMLLQSTLLKGARLARPGEFSERAFFNDKLDLAQAEAIADLIDSTTTRAAKLATRSLRGEFSARIHHLVDGLISLRMYVEAAIDFPDEEIDFLSDGKVGESLKQLRVEMTAIQQAASTGQAIRDGIHLVIAGPPNAGKSSILNALIGDNIAIVTDIPGTTRDVLREQINIDGMPIHIVDTAGLRPTEDVVEKEGIRRAHDEIERADCVLWVYDSNNEESNSMPDEKVTSLSVPVIRVRNKIDLSGATSGVERDGKTTTISISAKKLLGLDLLRMELCRVAGLTQGTEGEFIARRRHLNALDRASVFLDDGVRSLHVDVAGELLAEDLRQAQYALSEITGEFSADDLLGEIFSNFCIGK